MFGFRKGAAPAAEKPPRQTSIDNPFDSDDEADQKKTIGRRTASEPNLNEGKKKSKGDLDSMSVQELEDYAVDQAQETTKSVNNCLKIAEDIRGDASRTLETLHAQGEQIHRTHVMAADMEKDLSKAREIFCLKILKLFFVFRLEWFVGFSIALL